MRYRLIDLLACPYDGHFPLLLKSEEEAIVPECDRKSRVGCEKYCAYRNALLSDSKALANPCDGCLSIEIRKGTLYCPNCQRCYPIHSGIPHLVPDELAITNDSPPRDANFRVKWLQQQQRDLEADVFEEFFAPHQTYIDGTAVLDALDLQREDRLLDVGSGIGRLMRFVIGHCTEIVALDFSCKSLELLHRRCETFNTKTVVHIVMGDAEYLPFRDAIFHKIMSFGVLEHMHLQSNQATLRQMRRTLLDGCVAVLTAYNFTPLRKLVAPIWRHGYFKEGWHAERIFYYRFDFAEMRELVAETFPNCRIYGIRNLPKNIGGCLAPISIWIDRGLECTSLSRLTGYYLLVRGVST